MTDSNPISARVSKDIGKIAEMLGMIGKTLNFEFGPVQMCLNPVDIENNLRLSL